MAQEIIGQGNAPATGQPTESLQPERRQGGESPGHINRAI
jgi:hypothetical protein